MWLASRRKMATIGANRDTGANRSEVADQTRGDIGLRDFRSKAALVERI
jgi:hypothetical protein